MRVHQKISLLSMKFVSTSTWKSELSSSNVSPFIMVLNQNYVVKTLPLKTNEKTGPGTTFLLYQSVNLPSSSI